MCPASPLVVGWLPCSWNDITIMRGIQQQLLCPLPFPSECQISIPSRRRWSVPLGISAAFPPSHPICQTPPPPHVPLLPPAASHSLLSERAFISGDWGTLSCSHALRADFVPLSLPLRPDDFATPREEGQDRECETILTTMLLRESASVCWEFLRGQPISNRRYFHHIAPS